MDFSSGIAEPELLPSLLSGWLENPVYKCRNGKTVEIVAELQPADLGPSELRYEGKVQGLAGPQFYVWDRNGVDSAGDNRAWDIVGR